MGLVFDIKRFAIHDGPGIRTTVFLKGCPAACGACHNPESQAFETEILHREGRCDGCGDCVEACEKGVISLKDGKPERDPGRCAACGACVERCPAGALEFVGRETTVAEVMEAVERDRIFYDDSGGGATFSGGEPLAQPAFLAALLEACREAEIHTAVDTCGYAEAEILEKISGKADLFLYDLKLMDDDQHRRFTGVSNRPILENLKELSRKGCALLLRVPIFPGVNDDAENIDRLGAFVSSLEHAHPVDILPYHRAGMEKYMRMKRPYSLPEIRPPTAEKLAEVVETLESYGLHVTLGGEQHGHDG